MAELREIKAQLVTGIITTQLSIWQQDYHAVELGSEKM